MDPYIPRPYLNQRNNYSYIYFNSIKFIFHDSIWPLSSPTKVGRGVGHGFDFVQHGLDAVYCNSYTSYAALAQQLKAMTIGPHVQVAISCSAC